MKIKKSRYNELLEAEERAAELFPLVERLQDDLDRAKQFIEYERQAKFPEGYVMIHRDTLAGMQVNVDAYASLAARANELEGQMKEAQDAMEHACNSYNSISDQLKTSYSENERLKYQYGALIVELNDAKAQIETLEAAQMAPTSGEADQASGDSAVEPPGECTERSAEEIADPVEACANSGGVAEGAYRRSEAKGRKL